MNTTKSILFFFVFWPLLIYGQTPEEFDVLIREKIDDLLLIIPELDQNVTISFSGSANDMVLLLAESTKVNFALHPSIQQNVQTHFIDVPVSDVVAYICGLLSLDITSTGQIVQLLPFEFEKTELPVKPIEIKAADGLLSMDLENDTLSDVIRQIALLTSLHLSVDPDIAALPVSGYFKNVPARQAIEQITKANNLTLLDEDDFILIRPREVPKDQPLKNAHRSQARPSVVQVKSRSSGRADVSAINAPALEVIDALAGKMRVDYYVFSESNAVQHNGRSTSSSNAPVTMQLYDITFEEALDKICSGSDLTYRRDDFIFLIGGNTSMAMRNLKIIELQNRSAKGVIEWIPEELMTHCFVDSLFEYNSLIVAGPEGGIRQIEEFILSIDRLVPVVMIELIIVDVQSDKMRELGIEAGIAPGSVEPGGAIISSSDDRGGIDFTFSPAQINDLLSTLQGRGIANIGRVGSDFYLSLKAIEDQGLIDIESTPRLSTLNGHMADLSIGQKRYYLEQQVNYSGYDRPIPVQSNRFQEVEANLQISILPIVSGDDQVTLDISFEQSEFIGNFDVNTPPPQVSRKFESVVRVGTDEMVVLGGLERESRFSGSRGLPGLSRIPVLGWLFGRRKKELRKNKLLIFVRPTVIE